jgi:hypothetical protein
MTASEITPVRFGPSTVAGEREMLDGWLDFHRETGLADRGRADRSAATVRCASPSLGQSPVPSPQSCRSDRSSRSIPARMPYPYPAAPSASAASRALSRWSRATAGRRSFR